MSRGRFAMLLAIVLLTAGCGKRGPVNTTLTGGQKSSSSPPINADVDLSTYGIPGFIELPAGHQITQLAEQQIAIDREGEPFDLRILPSNVLGSSMESNKKSVLDSDDTFELLIDVPDGFVAFKRSQDNIPAKLQIFREVVLGGQKYVAYAFIDDRASKELADRVWKTAKTLRPK